MGGVSSKSAREQQASGSKSAREQQASGTQGSSPWFYRF
jgi:hypothetical protein